MPSPGVAEPKVKVRNDALQRAQLHMALRAATEAYPTARKLLLASDINYARELLVVLARDTGGWIGWEPLTLRQLANELTFTTLHTRKRSVAGDLEIRALINRALDRTIHNGRVRHIAPLAGGLGFRQSLRDSVLELRMAGVSASDLREHASPETPTYEVAAVLEEYETLLDAEQRADPAYVFRAALDVFESERQYVLGEQVFVVPTAMHHGLPEMLFERVIARGAQMLAVDVPAQIIPPERFAAFYTLESSTPTFAGAHVDIFSAATPSEELREIFRRVVAEGVRWDDVEIATTDPDTYGIALDVLCQRLDVGSTMLHGVPLARTRIGRALERWFTWLENGLPADVLRQALEAGELAAVDDVSAAALARELRYLQIGWGRTRYESALIALENDATSIQLPRADEDVSDPVLLAQIADRQRGRRALAAILRTILAALPSVPERGVDRPVRTSPSAIARATRTWLGLIPIDGVAERETVERIVRRLDQLALEQEEILFATALAIVRDALSDVRAWPLLTSERNPWRSTGGMVHLTDIAHAGTTGRGRVFVVGMDADRTGGARLSDPLIPDHIRQQVPDARLATAARRREESAYLLLVSLSALRGRITLSYAASGTLDGREAGPSSVLLQAWRRQCGDATLSYEQLRTHLAPPASAVPARQGEALLDSRDVWLDAIADGALLLDSETLVRQCFPSLDTGLSATALAQGESLTSYHGIVPRAAGVFDPTVRGDRAVSPSSLEQLAKCPLSWFYRYGLSIRLPNDPEYDPEQWLDVNARGNALHEVFESFAKSYQYRQGELTVDDARAHVITLTDATAERWRALVPPPSETVFESERAELRTAALVFLMMERRAVERGDAGHWYALEYAFGNDRPGRYTLEDGSVLALKGRADRIDELADGTLRVIDYKTGRSSRYAKRRKGGVFDGGRQLQPALYSAALETLLQRPVARFEYRFPTERGNYETVAYTANELSRARPIVTRIIGHVREGTFVPTTDAKDCGYCDFQTICRAQRDDFNNTMSPRATWAKEHAEQFAAFDAMRAHRGGEDNT